MIPATALDKARLADMVEASRPDYETALRTLVEIPSISAHAERKPDIRRAAEAAANLIRQLGGSAEVVATGGNPVVLGTFDADPASPAVVVYNHLDVQPAAEGKDGWTRPPFRFAIEGDRFYGRGATDDKGPAVTALFAAHRARQLGVPLTIRFVWELEEEIGSPHFDDFLKSRGAAIHPDSVLVSDTIWLAAGKPAVAYGLRGLAGALLRLETAAKDAHSGLMGGAARNPVAELCDVVARCVNARTGEILIDGFARTWSPPSPEERRDFLASGFSVESFRAAHELHSLRSDDPDEVTQRIWGRPTFEVHGIAGGYQEEGIKTVVPPWAEAKVSMRLVPPQEPDEVVRLLRAHVARLNPDVEVIASDGLRAFAGERSGPYAEAASDALEFGFGARPAFVREGGSIGAVLSMVETWRTPITLLGLSLPEHGYHGPNEYFDWPQARGGMLAFVRYFERIAGLGPSPTRPARDAGARLGDARDGGGPAAGSGG